MVRRRDRPRLMVREAFETTRLGQQCLINAYARLFPIQRAGVASGPIIPEQADRLVRRGGGKHA
ncbi:hypothetical protein SAMN04487779_1015103 [Belnapia rosea]|jgi:hypothetical protein|uniref:Uncharacterized protein n=1 Tax=Belnapia rosea TaxID=938405 RepID=A0A1G6Z521_9PROT|nr:hypothetical protein SAMN04487779_1015103 [Belnapia rosea]